MHTKSVGTGGLLRFGHARVLTTHRVVIHCARAASLPRRSVYRRAGACSRRNRRGRRPRRPAVSAQGNRLRRKFARSPPDKRACRSPSGETEPHSASQAKRSVIRNILCPSQRKKDTRRCPLRCKDATKKIFLSYLNKVSNSRNILFFDNFMPPIALKTVKNKWIVILLQKAKIVSKATTYIFLFF